MQIRSAGSARKHMAGASPLAHLHVCTMAWQRGKQAASPTHSARCGTRGDQAACTPPSLQQAASTKRGAWARAWRTAGHVAATEQQRRQASSQVRQARSEPAGRGEQGGNSACVLTPQLAQNLRRGGWHIRTSCISAGSGILDAQPAACSAGSAERHECPHQAAIKQRCCSATSFRQHPPCAAGSRIASAAAVVHPRTMPAKLTRPCRGSTPDSDLRSTASWTAVVGCGQL